MFVSFVRASGRGEAVWACERGVFVNPGGLRSNISSGLGFALGLSFSFLLKASYLLDLLRFQYLNYSNFKRELILKKLPQS